MQKGASFIHCILTMYSESKNPFQSMLSVSLKAGISEEYNFFKKRFSTNITIACTFNSGKTDLYKVL